MTQTTHTPKPDPRMLASDEMEAEKQRVLLKAGSIEASIRRSKAELDDLKSRSGNVAALEREISQLKATIIKLDTHNKEIERELQEEKEHTLNLKAQLIEKDNSLDKAAAAHRVDAEYLRILNARLDEIQQLLDESAS